MIKSLLKSFRYLSSVARENSKSKNRSPEWDKVRDEAVEKAGKCAACGSVNKLQVHHIAPFHLHPELELDENNLIVLCMDEEECHLKIGHGGSFKSYNPSVVDSAVAFLAEKSEAGRKLIVEDCKKNRREE